MKELTLELWNLNLQIGDSINLNERGTVERNKDWLGRRKVTISTANLNSPDQNTINLTNIELSDASKSLLSKGPSFVPKPYGINCYNSKKHFDNFVKKLRFQLQSSNQSSKEPLISNCEQQLEDPPPRKFVKT